MSKSNGIRGRMDAVQNFDKVHPWPGLAGTSDPQALAIFNANQCFRAFDDWNPSDLLELGRVSILQALAVKETDKYRQEGAVTYGGKSGDVAVENPRGRAIATLNSGITSSLRRLGLTASSLAGDKGARVNRAQEERKVAAARTTKKTPFDDSLLN